MKWYSLKEGSTASALSGLPLMNSPVAFEMLIPAPANASI
jgi:hypothetical protein